MKVTLVGGTGRIGRRLAPALQAQGLEVVAAGRSTGVDLLTGEGLASALRGAEVVVDLSNPPPQGGPAPDDFFATASAQLMRAADAAGVRRRVLLSVVGTDALPASPYFRGKHLQETALAASGQAHTVVRSTQFFEFLPVIIAAGARDGRVVLPALRLQPIAADDVVAQLVDLVLDAGAPVRVDVAGPEALPLATLARQLMDAAGDRREVVEHAGLPYFGAPVGADALLPGPAARRGRIRFDDWVVGMAGPGA